MTLREFIIHWNNTRRHDYWWRQKYNVAFNSEQHRATNQFDIAFEYYEDRLVQEEIENRAIRQKKEEEFKKTGQWITESKEDQQKADELFKKINIADFNG